MKLFHDHTFIALPSSPVISRLIRKISAVHPNCDVKKNALDIERLTHQWQSLGQV